PEDRPQDEVAWLVRVGTTGRHYRVLVPGHRSRSPLGPLVGNVDAAVCWAGWDPTDDSPPATRVARPARRRQPAGPRKAGGERAIPIKAGRRVRYAGAAAGAGGRAAHQRRGHWRRQRIGPHDDWHYEPRWIHPTIVGAVLADAPGRVYKVDW
ncbi:MAG: hypothetical protein LC792_04280, partial [Actinobacteria bacterium]|nr:hypothetical protein [Actinomycetota bacterium]